jgi:hypothetical protein
MVGVQAERSDPKGYLHPCHVANAAGGNNYPQLFCKKMSKFSAF